MNKTEKQEVTSKSSTEWSMQTLGIAGTGIYLGLLIALMIWRWQELISLPLNELGDFAAGAFGPLAVIWLVAGYFQQGEELQQNTKALNLQAEELANSVIQQSQLVDIARKDALAANSRYEAERLRAKKRSRPFFTFTQEDPPPQIQDFHSFSYSVKNTGADFFEAHANFETGDIYIELDPPPHVSKGEKFMLDVHIRKTCDLPHEYFEVVYKDSDWDIESVKVEILLVRDEYGNFHPELTMAPDSASIFSSSI